MGSILKFIFLFDEEYPSWSFRGPFTDYIQNNFEYSFIDDIDKSKNNILIIEGTECFKGPHRVFKTELYDLIKENNLKVIFASIADPCTWSDKINFMNDINSYGLKDKVYYVDTCVNHSEDYNTFCYHHFLEEPGIHMKKWGDFKFFEENELGYKSEDITPEELDIFRNKKFLSFNRTVDKDNRMSLFHTYLENDFSDSYFSFLNFCASDGSVPFFTKSKKLSIGEYKSKLPIELDTKNSGVDLQSFKTSNTFKKDLFLNSCINIVTETSFQCNGLFLSEKIIKPIICYQPFIVVGPQNYLKELRSLGYKTFSDFWDESYDEIENGEDRYFAIEKLILEFNSKSIDELNEIYQKTKNICIYNREVFNTFKEDSIPNIIKQIENEW